MKTVLVTGAAKRIGAVIATEFAKDGWSVIVHCNKSIDEAERLAKTLPGKGHSVVQGDFSSIGSINAFLAQLETAKVQFDCLVNSASCYSRLRLLETNAEEMERLYCVNMFAPFQLMRYLATHAANNACAINITDQRTAIVDSDAGAYGFAKKSLRDATEAAALAWAPKIRVNAVAPGLVLSPPGVDTSKIAALIEKVPLKHRSTEQEIAEACLFLAHSESITGQTIFVDGGMHLQGHPLETPPIQ